MSERDTPPQDSILLSKVEQILARDGRAGVDDGPFYGFCAQLAATVPRSDDAFRAQLLARLIAGAEEHAQVTGPMANGREQDAPSSPMPAQGTEELPAPARRVEV